MLTLEGKPGDRHATVFINDPDGEMPLDIRPHLGEDVELESLQAGKWFARLWLFEKDSATELDRFMSTICELRPGTSVELVDINGLLKAMPVYKASVVLSEGLPAMQLHCLAFTVRDKDGRPERGPQRHAIMLAQWPGNQSMLNWKVARLIHNGTIDGDFIPGDDGVVFNVSTVRTIGYKHVVDDSTGTVELTNQVLALLH